METFQNEKHCCFLNDAGSCWKNSKDIDGQRSIKSQVAREQFQSYQQVNQHVYCQNDGHVYLQKNTHVYRQNEKHIYRQNAPFFSYLISNVSPHRLVDQNEATH